MGHTSWDSGTVDTGTDADADTADTGTDAEAGTGSMGSDVSAVVVMISGSMKGKEAGSLPSGGGDHWNDCG